jgi:hypothetical protein
MNVDTRNYTYLPHVDNLYMCTEFINNDDNDVIKITVNITININNTLLLLSEITAHYTQNKLIVVVHDVMFEQNNTNLSSDINLIAYNIVSNDKQTHCKLFLNVMSTNFTNINILTKSINYNINIL